ncbi:unnamed protein product [Caenorhabditis sp. 36 PRJEB53466]|nr:unnamed protein product [Caenorhabditis sp. 36 PRJEB53466]
MPTTSFTVAPAAQLVTHGNRKTTPHEGFIEEKTLSTASANNHETPQTERSTESSTPETTTLQHSKTTTRSKIIHVGPNGVVEKVDESEQQRPEEKEQGEEEEGGNGHGEHAGTGSVMVIGPKAAKSLDPNRERLPHMKAIFADSLKYSAKGSTSVASAFALADFRRKKVSRPPEMSKVPEEVGEVATPTAEPEPLPKSSSLAKISTHTSISEPPTPVGIIETPILEKNSSSVSLVSANDNAPQLPSLPLPLPVPITTSTSTIEEKTEKEKERETSSASQEPQKVAETERPASSHSIGVQPTIWETYRVLGQQYSKSDLTERKPSVDSLEQMFEARLAETSRTTKTIPTVRTDKSDSSAIMFTAKPYKEEKEPEKETDSKLADMIGVTSFHSSQVPTPTRPQSPEGVSKEGPAENESGSLSPSLERSLEAALLIEMAKRGIELPLSPKTPVPTAGELEKIVAQKKILTDKQRCRTIIKCAEQQAKQQVRIKNYEPTEWRRDPCIAHFSKHPTFFDQPENCDSTTGTESSLWFCA